MTENQEQEQQTEEDETSKMTFDEKISDIFRKACQTAFLTSPELRSVIVVYDYHKDLNDLEGIHKGLWLHTAGGKEKPADSIVGSMGVVLQAAAHILDEQMALHAKLSSQLEEISKAILEKRHGRED